MSTRSYHSGMTTGPEVPLPPVGTTIKVLDRPLWGKGFYGDLVCWTVLKDGRYVVADGQVGPIVIVSGHPADCPLYSGTRLRVIRHLATGRGVIAEIA